MYAENRETGFSRKETCHMKWVSAFKYLPINYGERVATVKNLTQRVSFDNNLNGGRIRLRFCNRYARMPLRLDRVTAGTSDGGWAAVTLGGESGITLAPGQVVFSDGIDVAVRAGERLTVNIYIGGEREIESICGLWAKTNARVSFGAGDRTAGGDFEETQPDNILPALADDTLPDKMMYFFGFDALQVYTDDGVKVVAAFGDSITHMSYVTNALGKRLYAAFPGRVTLINSGIGGNRLMHDGTYVEETPGLASVFGVAGVKRFEHDVFEIDRVDSVLSLIGINDIMHPLVLEKRMETIPAEEIIRGYRTIAEIARAHGAKIYGGTVMPAGYDEYSESWLSVMEKVRCQVNDWIRGENGFDGYFDYDEALRDPERAGYMLPDAHLGDGLHPNGKGGVMAAAAVDINRLTGLSRCV